MFRRIVDRFNHQFQRLQQAYEEAIAILLGSPRVGGRRYSAASWSL